jgi:hypothetical protein
MRKPEARFADVRELVRALAPFAPVGTAGRQVAEAILAGTSGATPRNSLPPASAFVALRDAGRAQAAVASSAAGDEGRAAFFSYAGRRGAVTEPAWSRPRLAQARNRAVFVALLAGFVGLGVVGAAAIVASRRSTSPFASPGRIDAPESNTGGKRASASPTSSPTLAVSVVSAGTASSPGALDGAPEAPVVRAVDRHAEGEATALVDKTNPATSPPAGAARALEATPRTRPPSAAAGSSAPAVAPSTPSKKTTPASPPPAQNPLFLP